ncbi:MAG TPA: O-antigen ligase family protein [Rhodanobacteraceae bacterium]|nr:O-antigen ligase family protein [Rhodanobacteraceae bacterium]
MFPLILAYVVLTIIRPQDYMPQLAGIPMLPAALGGATVFWLLGSSRRYDEPQYLLLLLFTLFTAVSIAFNDWLTGGIEQLQAFAPILVLFVVLANAIDRPERVRTTMVVLVLCTTVLALHGVLQARNGIGWTGVPMSLDRRIQYVGIFQDPNDLGLLFVSVIPMAFWLSARGGWRRLFWLACCALMIYGVYLTKSRGTMLALAAIFGVYVWNRRGLFPAGVLGIIALVVMKAISPRMDELNADEESAFGRVDAWYTGLHLLMEHPILGVGTNNFTEYNFLTAHNSFVLVMAENGFIGYTLWLAFVCYGLWMALTVVRHVPDAAVLAADPVRAADWQRDHAIGLTLLLSQIGFIAAAFFLSRSYTVVLYLLQALVVGYYTGVRERHPDLPQFSLSEDLFRWPLLALGSVVVMFIVVRVLLATA